MDWLFIFFGFLGGCAFLNMSTVRERSTFAGFSLMCLAATMFTFVVYAVIRIHS